MPGGDVKVALQVFAEDGERMGPRAALEAKFLLWRATGDATHLVDAKHTLEGLVEDAPAELRESMLSNVCLHREIMEAWEEHGEKAGSEGTSG